MPVDFCTPFVKATVMGGSWELGCLSPSLPEEMSSLDPALPELCLIPCSTENNSSPRSPCSRLSAEKAFYPQVGGDLSSAVVGLLNYFFNLPHLPLPKKAKVRFLMVL